MIRRIGPRLLVIAGLLLIMALLTGCETEDPQNTLSPSGDVAEKIRDLFNIVLWPLVGIFVVVEGLIVFALFRFRRKRNDEMPKQVHGNQRLELAWTIAPALFLFVLAIPTLSTIIDLAEAPEGEALEVKVTGRQWSWRFEYPEYGIVTTNDMYVPAGKDQIIEIKVDAVDVIHSFWVPKVAGKIDAIPGHVNEMWFNVTEPGVYDGQCAEFCGLSHWNMRMKLHALPKEEFEAWVREQTVSKPANVDAALTWHPEE